MTTEQRNQIFEAIVILKGAANNKIIGSTDEELLNLLTDEVCKTMSAFWDLVDENKRLKEECKYFDF